MNADARRVFRIIRDCAWRNGYLTDLAVRAKDGKPYDDLVEPAWLEKEKQGKVAP